MSAGTSPSHADAWVRAAGLEMRAQYKAETADGRFFLMKSGGAKASSIRWLPADAVDFIRPVERVVKEPSRAVRNRLERTLRDQQEQHPGGAGAEAP